MKFTATLTAKVITGADKESVWATVVRLEQPEVLTLWWSPGKVPDAKAGRWELRKLTGGEPLATGVVTSLPSPGQSVQFDIDMRQYLPLPPPAKEAVYSVTVWPTKVSLLPGQKKPTYPPAGPKSFPLLIKYGKASGSGVKFDSSVGGPPPATYRICFEWIQCIEETNEAGDDEPFLIVYIADIAKAGTPEFANYASAHVFGPYDGDESIEKGESTKGSLQIWGDGWSISKPSNLLIAVALGEADDLKAPGAVEVEAKISYSILEQMSINYNWPKIFDDVRKQVGGFVLKNETQGSFDNPNDLIGSKLLSITQADLDAAAKGWHYKYLNFAGDGGRYKVAFSMKRG